MTANLRIVPYNDHDDAVLSVTIEEASGYPASNTQTTQRSKTWRSTSTTSQAIKGTFAASRTVSALLLFQHNLAGADVRLELFSDAAWATSVYDSTALAATCYTTSEGYAWSKGSDDPYASEAAYWLYFAEHACQSYRVTCSGTPIAASYFEIGRIWLGRYLELVKQAAYGLQLGREDLTESNRSRGGSLRNSLAASWRTLSLDLNNVQESEYGTWLQIMRRAGKGRDVAISVFPGDGTSKERDHCMNGCFVSLDALNRPASQLTKQVQIQEC